MPTPLLTIASAGINLGDRWLLRNADLTLHAGDRLALVGRNGAGKSSLMKLMAGRTDMDEGSLWMAPGSSVAYLPQAPQLPTGMTLRSVVVAGHDADWLGRPVPVHKAEEFLQRLGLDPNRMSDGLSGGEARRVSLARAIPADKRQPVTGMQCQVGVAEQPAVAKIDTGRSNGQERRRHPIPRLRSARRRIRASASSNHRRR